MLFRSSFAAMLGIWFAITGSGLWSPLVRPAFLPSPVTVVETFVKLAATGYQGHTLLHHFLISLMRQESLEAQRQEAAE